ncbi:hypothetical protein EZM97_21380 [Dyella soli]|uniref:Uncharacterized protein n=1 Tax=Dyella soli TaxID=522319 RepID=A0A4R0YQF1_9GAMM|nr:hypothetical protein [Dyella soli]TCI08810.1 hypothetical protein EZM97_21380 [Dyella soli]
MSPAEHRSPLMAGLGLRAHKGGAVVVGVAVAEGEPRVVLSTELATCSDGDRLSFEPYRVAADMPRGPDGKATVEAAASVAEGRRRQDQLATDGMQGIVAQLEAAACKPSVAALLLNRAGWITDLLDYSLAWREHVPVAEGLAVRDALRFASRQCAIELAELDEKSLVELASATLAMPSTAIAAKLKRLGAPMGRPWRKEQKLACLAAWVALARPC